MNAPMMTPMIPTKDPPFGKWSPIAAFDFDVFDADEEPEVLLAEVPLVAVALATDEEFVAPAFLPLLMLEVVTQDDDDGAG